MPRNRAHSCHIKSADNASLRQGVAGGEATLTKLHYLLSQGLDAEAIRDAMSRNLRGELTPDE